jgi:hypothetical protein
MGTLPNGPLKPSLLWIQSDQREPAGMLCPAQSLDLSPRTGTHAARSPLKSPWLSQPARPTERTSRDFVPWRFSHGLGDQRRSSVKPDASGQMPLSADQPSHAPTNQGRGAGYRTAWVLSASNLIAAFVANRLLANPAYVSCARIKSVTRCSAGPGIASPGYSLAIPPQAPEIAFGANFSELLWRPGPWKADAPAPAVGSRKQEKHLRLPLGQRG